VGVGVRDIIPGKQVASQVCSPLPGIDLGQALFCSTSFIAQQVGGKAGYNLSMLALQTRVPLKEITAFCKRWKVVEFALFGSALREDFSSQSDIDALVSFAPHSNRSLFDHVRMQAELQEIFGRQVDLITRRALDQSRNTLLRSEILGTAKIIYSENEPANVQASG
jgi:predicted nucleotidyltransferase